MIIAINGMVTTPEGALYNKDAIKRIVENIPVKEKIFVDYVYNATHLVGIGDFLDSANQKIFEKKVVESYDLVNILNDLSQKVKTQKVLFVAHSQGNFYANNIYDVVASKPGGIPQESLSIYGIGSPADHVAGGGKYITSSTDGIINLIRKLKFLNVLEPNVNIQVPANDDSSGHNLSRIYLQFQGDRITSELEGLLSNLKENDEQLSDEPCLSPVKVTGLNKLRGVLFAVADPTVKVAVNGLVGTYKAGAYIADAGANAVSFLFNGVKYLVKKVGNFGSNNLASVGSSFSDNDKLNENPVTLGNIPQYEIPLVVENPILIEEETPPLVEEEMILSTENLPDENIETEIVQEEVLTTETVEEVIATEGTEPIEEKELIPEINLPVYGGGGGGGSNPPIDTIPPVISVIGDNPLSVEKDSIYTDLGATALDDVDGTITVVVDGLVDTTILGAYTITYTATDSAENIATETRIINVIDSSVTDTTSPVITINGNIFEAVILNSIYTDLGATALDEVDGVIAVDISGSVDTSVIGSYDIIYTAIDTAGNSSTLSRTVKVSSYVYIPKYKFGTENGDGNDWQVWSFNGSNIYDWSDTYVDNYLREQFKIQAYSGGFWCSNCLQRGIFNHDPREGFETSDLIKSTLEENPQNNSNGLVYDVSIQWDELGYTYSISHDGTVDTTGHTDISNISEDMWVGWDGSQNNFQTFPSGNWQDSVYESLDGRQGGSDMVLQPYPVYVYFGPVLSNEKKIMAFNFNELSPIVTGIIDDTTHNISLIVPFGTDITNLIPVIIFSDKSSISPLSGVAQDFTNTVAYTVTAENNSTQEYTVTVIIEADPNPPLDITPPSITSYTFNNLSSDITINPTADNPLSLIVNSSENVNWMSIKIEKTEDISIYKIFQSDSSFCIDDTSICTKNWNGILSSGGLLENGVYRIKLHIKDPAGNEFYDYLSPYVINIDTSL